MQKASAKSAESGKSLSDEKDSDDEYEEERRDGLEILKDHLFVNLTRARSMSPNHTFKRRTALQNGTDESPRLQRRRRESPLISTYIETAQDSEPQTLEDLPVLEIEGAPEGWNRGGRRRTLAVPEPIARPRRGSMFPGSVAEKENNRRQSVTTGSSGRRASQMSFDEWCQLKKFQEMHNATINGQNEKSGKNNKRLIKRNISYEEWCNASEEKKRREIKEMEDQKLKLQEEKTAQEQAKFKRSMSHDKWMAAKEAAKAAAAKVKKSKSAGDEGDGSRRNSVNSQKDDPDASLTPEERKKKAEEAHRKWAIKKDLDEIKKERDMLLRMQNAKLTIGDPSHEGDAAPVRKRRTSWMDAYAATQVAMNRNKLPA